MPKLRVLLMQLPVPNNPGANVPLAAGYLKAYARERGLLERADIDILPRALADHAGDALLVEEIAARAPDVLGVSLYTWNSERSLDVARRLKQRRLEMLVVVGGPEVQRDSAWVLEHAAVDVAVIGEGEQTFAELITFLADTRPTTDDRRPTTKDDGDVTFDVRCSTSDLSPAHLVSIPGLAFRDDAGKRVFSPDRVPLGDLAALPSPYLAGYLDVPQDGMLMVEVSRWCPYSCSFCLYGRNMGAKLGSRYFGLERVLAEIRWGRERGVKRVHFVEANLNLVPLFWRLMRALEDLNGGHEMTFYAELRGEHLTEEVVAALDRANVRHVEVGLQSANPAALKASLRRTDLGKWAAGTRRLYEHGIEVFLDVILGLPADDEAGIAATLDFIRSEGLGPYDIFTLQVLPGTAVRQQAAEYGLRFQDRPPYYVLETNTLDFARLRRLRRDLKRGAGLDPDEVEGCPRPRLDALNDRRPRASDQGPRTNDQELSQAQESHAHHVTSSPGHPVTLVDRLWLLDADETAWNVDVTRLARHVDVAARWDDAAALADMLRRAIAANPSTLFDCYLLAEAPPVPAELRAWRAALPFQLGYLDRVAVYQAGDPERGHMRVSPRCFLVLPWTSIAEPADFGGVAELIWRFELAEGEDVPLNAWYGAGGSGVCLRFRPGCTENYRSQVVEALEQWKRETGRFVWLTQAAGVRG